ncbi:uncharacterized protein LOC106129493 isoform X1 [Amyelois transitella]|uniref:uncharacterized protein LOC106129493 isoform X1 n=1 Tax=Amyelois transitella TaxID=680683 RepID=UPI00067D36A2|nr:uncharacterized protein LOC106129493 isoform X1 [Amyelois transitella]XP_060808683.1 uncharacterized protein LOC106129493 isoform X1 [Amyelois transitella]
MEDDFETVEEAPKTPINFGAAVMQSLAKTIENMDLPTVLKKMVATNPEDEDSEEIRDKLKGVLDRFNSMSDEEKVAFTKQVKDGLVSKISAKLQDPNAINFGGIEEAIREAVISKLIMAGVVAFVLFLLIVFFGYKLYKSIKEKEKKKEEKKKAKQMKKKK